VLSGFWWGNLSERDHLENLGLIGRLILMDLQEEGWGMIWIDLDQDVDGWRALVNAVMSLRVP